MISCETDTIVIEMNKRHKAEKPYLGFIKCLLPAFGLMSRVFVNGPGDQGSIPARVIPNSQKTVLDASLLSTQHYKVRLEGKVGQSREWSNDLSYILVL